MANGSAGMKVGGLVLLASFILMFGSSVLYRISNPSRVIHRQVQTQADHGDAGQANQTGQAQEGIPLPGGISGNGDGQGMGAMGGMGGNQQAMAEIGRLMGQLQQNPNDVATIVSIGKVFLQTNSLDRAEGFAKRAINLAPEDPEALNLAAVTAFARDKHEASAEYFERLVAVKPDDGPAWYNLGMLYKHHLNQLDRAAKAFETAQPLAGQDPELKARLEAELEK